jgi:hypothetical protein
LIAYMVGIKRTISTAIVALAVASVVRADMMPMSPSEGVARREQSVFVQTAPQQASDSQSSVTFLGVVDLDLQPIGSWVEVKSQVGDVAPAQAPEILTDRQSSLGLCLYALLGLGLCHSAPLVKKFHFGCIPEWYHSGGPSQIGHSFAISPDCLSSAPVYCFVQPADAPDAPLPQYRWETVVSLWRESQFTPAVLAARGPPSNSLL